MKKLMAVTLLFFGLTFGSHASGKNPIVEKRASNLSNKMIRGLRLNNFQSNKVREINEEVVAKMLAVEEAYAGNQEVIDQKCKEICSVRDRELERVLSTAQYNAYFGNRKVYDKEDKAFMAGLKNVDTEQAGSIAAANSAETTTETALN